MEKSLKIQLLGTFHMEYHGKPVEGLDSARLQELLAWLLLNRNEPQPRRHIAFQFWPDSSEKQALANLRNLLYKLRRNWPDCENYILIRNKNIQWNTVASYRFDVSQFEHFLQLANKAESEGNSDLRLELLKKVEDLYKGDLFENCYKNWLEDERHRLKQDYVYVLKSIIELYELQKCYKEAIPYARKMIKCDEYDERSYRRLMHLYMLSGRRAMVLKTYQKCKNILRNELQIEPSRKTKELYNELKLVDQPHKKPLQDGDTSESYLTNQKPVSLHKNKAILDNWLRPKKGLRISAVVITLLILVAFGLSIIINSQPSVPDKSLAVLPLKSKSENPNVLEITQGIHQGLTNRLAGFRGLKVISRSSVLDFSPQNRDMQQIAEDLNVSTLLHGSVHLNGDHIHVSVELVNANNLITIWNSHYEEKTDEASNIQNQIARDVARRLQAPLTAKRQKRLENRPTDNLQAFSLYMKGREHLSRSVFDNENLTTAEALFKQALEKDSLFTHAWAMLSLTYSYLYALHGNSPEHYKKLKQTAERALELNANLPETHLAMGTYLYWSDTEHERAITHFKAALDRFPNNAELHLKTALLYRRKGKWDLLFQHLKQALELDPLNVSLYTQLAWNYYLIRDYEKAVSYLARLSELGFSESASLPYALVIRSIQEGSFDVIEQWRDEISPSDPANKMPFLWGWYNRVKRDWDEALRSFKNIDNEIIWSNDIQYELRDYWIATTLDRLGKHNEALKYYNNVKTHLEQLRNEYPEQPRYRTALGKVYARLGEYEKAIHEGKKAVELVPVSQNAATGALYELILAEIYTWCNRKKQAVDQLEYTLSIPGYAHKMLLRTDPKWDPLRDHPKFQKLISGTDKPFLTRDLQSSDDFMF